MTAAPKLGACMFCGGPLLLYEACDENGIYHGWYIAHRERDECAYGSGTYETPASCIAAHDRATLAVRLFPRAVRLLRETSADNLDPREWLEQRDALLTEAQGVAS